MTAGIEATRARLVAAVSVAQTAMADVVDAAAEYDALQPENGSEGAWPVGGGVLLAWLAYRVVCARYGPGDRLAAHLRYFAGQRFLDERPDGLLATVARPREHCAPPGRPP